MNDGEVERTAETGGDDCAICGRAPATSGGACEGCTDDIAAEYAETARSHAAGRV